MIRFIQFVVFVLTWKSRQWWALSLSFLSVYFLNMQISISDNLLRQHRYACSWYSVVKVAHNRIALNQITDSTFDNLIEAAANVKICFSCLILSTQCSMVVCFFLVPFLLFLSGFCLAQALFCMPICLRITHTPDMSTCWIFDVQRDYVL